MAVKIRLKRMGRTHRPFYRVNATNDRSPRDGSVLEELGFYDPIAIDEKRKFVVNLDRCRHWLDNGAIPSETVSTLFKRSGLEHKQLKLPRPGKPKVVPPVPGKKADKPAAAAPTAPPPPATETKPTTESVPEKAHESAAPAAAETTA